MANNIRFDIQSLHGTLAAAQPNTPVSLENLAAYEVKVDHAHHRIADSVLQAPVQAELQASEAPLRIKQVTTQTDGMLITGDMKRLGLWIPFTMKGTPAVALQSQANPAPPFYCKADCPANFVYTHGGELRAAGMVLGRSALVTGISNGSLPIALHGLNSVISTSTEQRAIKTLLRSPLGLWMKTPEFTALGKGSQYPIQGHRHEDEAHQVPHHHQ